MKIHEFQAKEILAKHGVPVPPGKHATTACRKCHSTAQQREADVRKMGAARRKRTYFGLKRGCVNCHTDHHNGALGTRCQTCHVQTSFKTVSRFPGHNKTHFPLRGKHAKIACKSCHKSPSGRWRFQNVPHATCNSCHTTAHPQTMGQKRGTVGRRCSSWAGSVPTGRISASVSV